VASAALVAAATALLTFGSTSIATAMPRAAAVPHFDRVAVIVLENESYDGIIGNPDAPFLNELASGYGLATDFFATTHPSLPNYLALIGGSTFGVHSDCTKCKVGKQRNLVDQLEGKGISWKAYMSAMPSPCYTGPDTGLYAKRHDPFLFFDDIVTNPDRCNKVVPFDQMAADIAAGTLPRFVWITPDLCQDMHDCPIASGDQFLAEQVPTILDQLGSNGVLFITWDEGDRTDASSCCDLATGGHIVTLVIGPGVVPGTIVSTPIDHYSILQTIEDGFGLRRLRNARCLCTPSMGEFFS
jgi:hypothetical protein